MKFKIRAPFTVHIESVVEQTDLTGRKQKVGKTESHFSGVEIDISEAEARKHLHKLEPADDDARQLFDSIYANNETIRKARVVPTSGLTEAEVDAKIEAAVAKASAAQAAAPAKR